jgi:hypothetical protein
LNLPCVQRILEGVPEGQRNAGAHILAIAARLDGLPQKEAQKAMLEYADNCSKDNISESEYLGWVYWIFKEKPFWNCRLCKELGLCEEGCKFHEAAFKDVLDFLKGPDLIKKIDEILGKRIKKDRKNRMLVFFVCFSAYGSSPLNLFLKGESSIGKTHIAKSVAEYFPEEDVWFIGDMSPKALIHEHGEFRDGKVYISLENKILVFMETPRRETLEMLKPILSHDRTEIEYKIADKRASGQLGTKRVIICGWPATVFCTTDFKYLEELSTRSVLTTPEVTEEKIAQVLKFKGSQYSRPWKNTEDEQERILKEALKALQSGKKVCVPYADELAEGYEKSEPRVMRDFDKLMELIRMSAFLHQKQRAFIELDSTEEKYIIATEYDYWIGRLLFEAVKETTVTGIPQPVIDFYLNIIEKIQETITYRSIREKYVQVKRKPISRTHVRNKFVEPLESIGWLSRDYDSVDRRVVVFEKCRIEPEITETMGDYEASYFKDIFPEEKLKEYVGELEKIWNKKGIDDNILDCAKNGNNWFCTEEVPYFLEPNNGMKEGIKDEKVMKNESSTNPHSLGQTQLKCEMEENQLIDHYDEETVLLQIPQDDTRIEDVIKKFKDSKKVTETIGILKEKGKIMLGQGLIRVCRSKNLINQYDENTVLQQIPEENISIQDFVRKFEDQNKVVDTLYILEKKGRITASHGFMRKVKISETDNCDSPGPRLNTWMCGICGIKFKARIPFEDYSGHAICEECWKILTDS